MHKLKLKNLYPITNQNKSLVFKLVVIFTFALYFFANNIHLFEVKALYLFEFEKKLPLNPLFIWPYVLMYPYCIFIGTKIKNLKTFNALTISFLALQICAFFIFMFFPISYPREFYPLPIVNDISVIALRIIRSIDQPTNAFPSLHVANCFFISFIKGYEKPKTLLLTIPICIIISLSTLYVKQHYLLDVLVGTFLAVLFFSWFLRLVKVKSNLEI